jgi:protoporphyrinogen oxidase
MKKTIVIIGSGPAGLMAGLAAFNKNLNVIILEKNSFPGGKGSSIKHKDYTVDYGPHVFHPSTKSLKDLITKYSYGMDFQPKIQQSLYVEDLPMDYPFRISQALSHLKLATNLKIFRDYFYIKIKSIFCKIPKRNFKEFGIANFGNTLYQICFGRYSERVWGCSADNISIEFARRKLPSLSLRSLLIDSLFKNVKRNTSYHDSGFLYHKNGIGSVFQNIADDLTNQGAFFIYDSVIEKFVFNGTKITGVIVNGAEIQLDYLVTTIPLDDLISLLSANHPAIFSKYIGAMQYRNSIFVNVILNRTNFSPFNWSFLVNDRFIFNRVSEQKNLFHEFAPNDKTLITLERVCKNSDPEWLRDSSMWRSDVERELGFFNILSSEIEEIFIAKLEKSYPFMYVGYESQKDNFLKDLSIFNNLITTGRYGLCIDSDMHDSMQLGREAVSYLINGKVSDFYSQHEQICKARTD